jgi:hypothetical protein
MAARRPIAIRPVAATPSISVDDPQVDRAIASVRSSVETLERTRQRVALTFDLIVGTNKVRHGLGRAFHGYSITPTVASAAFAHAVDTSNPRPDLEAWITVIGADQPDARLEVF